MTSCVSCARTITGKAPDVMVCSETYADVPTQTIRLEAIDETVTMPIEPPRNAVYCLECAMREIPDAFSHRLFPLNATSKETQKR